MTSRDDIRAALAHVPAHDREMWLRMGMAVKSELGDDGFDLWDEWSQQDDSYRAADARAAWRSIKTNGKVTIGTLYHEAQRHGFRWNGHARPESPSAAEIERRERAKQEDDEREARERADAAALATRLFKAATPVRPDHPYLVRKGVVPVETLRELAVEEVARLIGYVPKEDKVPLSGRLLVVPVRIGDAISTVEFIDEEGRKSALAGGKKSGGFWSAQRMPVGGGEGMTVYLAEGVTTTLTVREAKNAPAFAALSCGNLVKAALALRARLPKAVIVVCGDLGNGERHAHEAARTIDGKVAFPDFGADRPDGATDFNDLAQHRGAEAVERAVRDARAPDGDEGHSKSASAPTGDSGGEAWPDPRPLPDALAPVEPFAFELLPNALRGWIEDITERVQCPPDFVAVGAVAALGSLIGCKVGVRPQARTDWTEVGNQWALVVGRPGVMKSPAIEQALGPLRRLEASARERHAAALTTFRADEVARSLRVKAGEADARRLLAKNRNADVSHLLHREDDTEPPTCRRYSTSDTSMESLAELVRLNPSGVLVHRDEMVSLLRDLDREEKAAARGFYLTGWNGSTPYTVDRIGRGLDLHIPAVCLSMIGGTQPGRLAGYVHAAVRGRSGDDGLIQRFGLMVWPDLSGEWRNVDRWPDSDARRAANETFARLDELSPAAVGAVQDAGIDGRSEGVSYLRLGGESLESFVGWRTDLERRLRSGEFAPALESHLAKYRKLVPSLALIFHLADGNGGPIGEFAMIRALGWATYLESHARRVYGSGAANEAATARAIVDRIRRGDLPAAFAGWQVWRPGWSGLADRHAVEDGLSLLVDFGYLTVKRIATAGRDATRFSVNPKVLT